MYLPIKLDFFITFRDNPAPVLPDIMILETCHQQNRKPFLSPSPESMNYTGAGQFSPLQAPHTVAQNRKYQLPAFSLQQLYIHTILIHFLDIAHICAGGYNKIHRLGTFNMF